MSDIFLYNTKSRAKERFEALNPPRVTMYNCGPTVYNYAHIGNLRGYVFADLLRRTLEHDGFDVEQVINITDVGHLVSDDDTGEDKMEKGARRENKSVGEIVDFYTEAFFRDLAALDIDPEKISRFPKATEHIKEQIELIQTLEEKGYTYAISDGIYFDTSKFPEYGALAGLDVENLKEGARVEANPEKRKSTDFALWKFSGEEKRLQEWESPWGVGFPGWHLECSAMAMKYLGETLDIHTGGIDHIPVHHTNEIAQSVAATGKEFARYWLHFEFVTIKGEKMAKSGENFVRLETLTDKGFSGLDYRYLLLLAHYRSPISFSFDALKAAANARARLLTIYKKASESGEGDRNEDAARKYEKQMQDALKDDINSPEALAALWNALKDDSLSPGDRRALIEFADMLLGIGLEDAERGEEIPKNVLKLAEEREKARAEKDFDTSDKLRDKIAEEGFDVRDESDGFHITRLR